MITSVNSIRKQERVARILDAALEVFSEFSFDASTTGEIAKRAHSSKREIYTYFPDKQALLTGLVIREMRRQHQSFREAIAYSQKLTTLRKKLEFIGLAVVTDLVSLRMSVVRRLVISQSLRQPLLGGLVFEDVISQRCEMISEVLRSCLSTDDPGITTNLEQESRRYFAMISSFPLVMTDMGFRKEWTEETIETHVTVETDVFLNAHPAFTEGRLARVIPGSGLLIPLVHLLRGQHRIQFSADGLAQVAGGLPRPAC